MAPSKTPIRQSARTDAMRAVFEGAGFVNVEPPLLQPADVFLDRSGEDIRRRLFVFNDPAGQELCLRPDLTIPTCRLYLDGNAGRGEARLCYSGAAFRYDAQGSGEANEFIQTGAEFFGGKDAEAADAEMLALTTSAARAGGLEAFNIKLGDLALFDALVDALDIPAGWRSRLKRHFWRPAYFKELLTSPKKAETPSAVGTFVLDALGDLDKSAAQVVIQDVLDLAKIVPVGGRSVEEIAERFLERSTLGHVGDLPAEIAKFIDTFLSLSLKPKDAAGRLRELAKGAKIKLDAPIAALERRFELIDKRGVDLNKATFETGFGRKLEYYTGFVFELSVGDNVFAGGGRYDGLLQSLGAKSRVPAVGCAITLERLTAAIAAAKGRAAK